MRKEREGERGVMGRASKGVFHVPLQEKKKLTQGGRTVNRLWRRLNLFRDGDKGRWRITDKK